VKITEDNADFTVIYKTGRLWEYDMATIPSLRATPKDVSPLFAKVGIVTTEGHKLAIADFY